MSLPPATQQLYIQIETAFSEGNWDQMIQRCRNLLELKEFFSRYDLPEAMPEFQKDRALRELESSRGAWSTHSNDGRRIEEVRKTTDYRSAKPSLQKGKGRFSK